MRQTIRRRPWFDSRLESFTFALSFCFFGSDERWLFGMWFGGFAYSLSEQDDYYHPLTLKAYSVSTLLRRVKATFWLAAQTSQTTWSCASSSPQQHKTLRVDKARMGRLLDMLSILF